MITPAYALTATERVLPRMALDFTTGVLDPRVTVTRALNTATRVNSSGFVEVVNANLPRFDYDPVTLAPKGLLIEEARTNDILYSSGVAGIGWQTSQAGTATIATTLNYSVAPDGTTTATRVIFNNNGGSGTSNLAWFAQVVLGRLIGTSYADSIWLKTNDNSTVTLLFRDDTAARFNQLITITGTWTRFSLAGAATAAGTQCCKIWIRSGVGTSTFADISAWGGQSETGAFSTSYIPTTTLATLRNADSVTMTGTNFSDWYNATSGAILARSHQSVITGTRPSIYISDGTANNIISLRGLAANPELYIKATTDQAQIDAGTLTANSSFGLVGAWTTDNCAAAINGGAAVTDTSATIPTVDRMLIGSDGTNYLNGQVERISYWPQRLINAEVQAFSK